MGPRPNQTNKARWARTKPSPVLVRPGRSNTDVADPPRTKQRQRKRIHVRTTRLMRTLSRQGAHFGPLTDTSGILGKPNIWLTYKKGYSDTPHAEKFNKEKEKNEKLKEVKARLNFDGSTGTSQYSESRTMSTKEYEKSRENRTIGYANLVPHVQPLTGSARVWFDDLSPESIDSYDDLKKAFLENYLQQKKCIKDPIELHNIKQRDGESTKDFVRRYKLESKGLAYKLELPEELRNAHNTFHVSNLKKCLSDESLVILMKELRLDDKLNFVEEPVEIMDLEVKQQRQSCIPIFKVRWNSKRGPKFMWEREDEIRAKYPYLFSNITSKSN
ncbi:putative reverse transcriptase domain-containing protein [Tanacetum coccineum]|uniref:Reverse transcriptase domain-containing protein n=1 Tax=Tanacetum coccineum TaxID=301880 RepID=A0ABQ5AWJ9_9ASTR